MHVCDEHHKTASEFGMGHKVFDTQICEEEYTKLLSGCRSNRKILQGL